MDQSKEWWRSPPMQANDADAEYRLFPPPGIFEGVSAPPVPTPLVELLPDILCKLECNNPSGSHKMRVARFIMNNAIAQGHIVPGRTTVIDHTEGNFGMALAVECHKLGVELVLAVNARCNPLKMRCMEMFGARLIGVEMIRRGARPRDVVDLHLTSAKARGLDYFFTDQYHNPASLLAHEQETGPEIAAQISTQFPEVKRLIFVACAGTGASLMGIAKALREAGYRLDVILAEPHGCITQINEFSPHPMEGMAEGGMPPFVRWSWVRTSEPVAHSLPFDVRRFVVSKSGLYIGNSSAACVAIGIAYLPKCDHDTKILTIAYDSGLWYSEKSPSRPSQRSQPWRPSTRGASSQGM